MNIRKMTSEKSAFLSHIEEYATRNSYDFHSFFRDRSLALQPLFNKGLLNLKEAISFGSEIQIGQEYYSFVQKNLGMIKANFLSILLSRRTDSILWSLHCIPSKNALSLLTEIVPALDSIATVIRGGPNLYKLNGWVVHVLIGYSILTKYIPAGRLPSTITWDRDVITFVRDVLRNKYWSLDRAARAILHVAMFTHDIGVSVAVEDHDKYGVPLVPDCLKDICITEETLGDNNIDIALSDFIWCVQTVIALHTFVNRIGIEYSQKRSEREICKVVSTTLHKEERHCFLRDNLPSILLLLGVADLIAVDDKLLDGYKVREIDRGYNNLLLLTKGIDSQVNEANAGYDRFLSFLGSNAIRTERIFLENTLGCFGYPSDLFWTKFYNIEELNFALSLVPFLPEPDDILLTFLLLFSFIDHSCGTDIDTYKSTRIVFDHNLRPESLMTVISHMKTFGIDKYRSFIGSEGWLKLGLHLKLSVDASGNTVFVKKEEIFE